MSCNELNTSTAFIKTNFVSWLQNERREASLSSSNYTFTSSSSSEALVQNAFCSLYGLNERERERKEREERMKELEMPFVLGFPLSSPLHFLLLRVGRFFPQTAVFFSFFCQAFFSLQALTREDARPAF